MRADMRLGTPQISRLAIVAVDVRLGRKQSRQQQILHLPPQGGMGAQAPFIRKVAAEMRDQPNEAVRFLDPRRLWREANRPPGMRGKPLARNLDHQLLRITAPGLAIAQARIHHEQGAGLQQRLETLGAERDLAVEGELRDIAIERRRHHLDLGAVAKQTDRGIAKLGLLMAEIHPAGGEPQIVIGEESRRDASARSPGGWYGSPATAGRDRANFRCRRP